MENQIFRIENNTWKSIALREKAIWFSEKKLNDLDKFAKEIHDAKITERAYACPLDVISEVSFNEASETVKIRYKNEFGEQKKLKIEFGDQELSNQFGHYLGGKLALPEKQKQERQWKPLLLNLLYLILAIVGTIYLGTMEDTEDLIETGSRRSRGRLGFLKIIVDTIGQTGVVIIGTLISILIIYQAYQRFKKPANEIVYQG